jgi:hypothetical protein
MQNATRLHIHYRLTRLPGIWILTKVIQNMTKVIPIDLANKLGSNRYPLLTQPLPERISDDKSTTRLYQDAAIAADYRTIHFSF